jgi:hypothetical protein
MPQHEIAVSTSRGPRAPARSLLRDLAAYRLIDRLLPCDAAEGISWIDRLALGEDDRHKLRIRLKAGMP